MSDRTRYQPITLPGDCLEILRGFAKLPNRLGRTSVIKNALYSTLFRLEANRNDWKATNLDDLIRSRYRWLYPTHNTQYYTDGEIDGLISRLLTVPDAPKRQPLTVAAIRFYAYLTDWSMLSGEPLNYTMPIPQNWWDTVCRFHWIDQAKV